MGYAILATYAIIPQETAKMKKSKHTMQHTSSVLIARVNRRLAFFELMP